MRSRAGFFVALAALLTLSVPAAALPQGPGFISICTGDGVREIPVPNDAPKRDDCAKMCHGASQARKRAGKTLCAV